MTSYRACKVGNSVGMATDLPRLRRISILVCALALMQAIHAPGAEVYPGKPIRLIHGYPGSSTDTNARYIAQKLTELMGQQVIVDMKPGATGTIAADFVAKSASDGYTLLMTPGSALGSAPHLRTVPFDTLRDFAPIAQIGQFSFLLAAHPTVPAHNARELIALAKTRRVSLTYGTTAVGSAYHLAGVLFCMMAGIEMVHVPYPQSGSAALTDLISGRTDLGLNSPVFLLPHVRAGKLRAIGVTGSHRMASASDVPTIAESGLPGFEMVGWQGIVAPAGTPKEIIATLHAAVQKIMHMPETRKRWDDSGLEVTYASPEQFGAALRLDYEQYGKLIAKIGNNIAQ
jgi:tripartite-type tricarboxylate transporter receptor subunit TctC